MPIAERDYMKDRPNENEPTRVQKARHRRGILFRWLVILWLLYLTIHTHNVDGIVDRIVEILSGITDATTEFFKNIKGVVFKESSRRVPKVESPVSKPLFENSISSILRAGFDIRYLLPPLVRQSLA